MSKITYLIMLAVYAILLDLVVVYLIWRQRRQRRAAASIDAASGGATRP